MKKYYDSFYNSHFAGENDRDSKRSIAIKVFMHEANFSLISSCSCLTVSNDDDETVLYVFCFQPTSKKVPSPEVIKKSCSTQLSMKFFLLINVKMPTIVGILTFMSMQKWQSRLI